jgi:proline dehydrogenase
MTIKIADAIKKINPNAQYTYQEEDIDSVKWLNGTTPIPKADIEAKMVEVQAEYDANQYQRDRATAYPSIQDQLDMQYWDKVNGTTNWEDAIAKVKSDNPKD